MRDKAVNLSELFIRLEGFIWFFLFNGMASYNTSGIENIAAR
jgi:hypothetical protein